MKLNTLIKSKALWVLLVTMTAALVLRIWVPFHSVFADGWVRYQINDPYHHMRVIGELVRDFPHRMAVDPLGLFPDGHTIVTAPLFDYLVAGVAWLLGAGHPSWSLIEAVGAYSPAILGALVVIPVYVIGRELFDWKAGAIAALVLAVLPGQFLMRSLLGFTDNHVLEVLLSTTYVMFLMLALRREGRRRWVYSGLAGLMLGLYMLAWSGAAMFAFVTIAFLLVQMTADHLRGRDTKYLVGTAVPVLLVALIIIAPFSYPLHNLQMLSLGAGVFVALLGWGVGALLRMRGVPAMAYPLFLAAVIGPVTTMLWIAFPSTFSHVLGAVNVFSSSSGMLTVSEVQATSARILWGNFTTTPFVALAGLAVLLWTIRKEQRADRVLLLVWSAVTLVAALAQMRFLYYMAVNVSLLAGLACWAVLEWSGALKNLGAREEVRRKRGKKKVVKEKAPASSHAYAAIMLAAVMALLLVPSVGKAVEWAGARSGQTDNWHEVLVWLGNSTEEGDYGVLSWWDYGYWITYTAERAPNANPSGSTRAAEAGMFFVETDTQKAEEVIDSLGSRYVVIDVDMTTGKYYAMLEWAMYYPVVERVQELQQRGKYFDVYYVREGGVLRPVMLFFPSYYQSMCARLFNFGGQEVVPRESTWVIRYAEKTTPGGEAYREIVEVLNGGYAFATYEEALPYLEEGTLVVNTDPFKSPVPLERLENFEAVYRSEGGTVAVFEYTGGAK